MPSLRRLPHEPAMPQIVDPHRHDTPPSPACGGRRGWGRAVARASPPPNPCMRAREGARHYPASRHQFEPHPYPEHPHHVYRLGPSVTLACFVTHLFLAEMNPVGPRISSALRRKFAERNFDNCRRVAWSSNTPFRLYVEYTRHPVSGIRIFTQQPVYRWVLTGLWAPLKIA